ncbi:MAG: Ig-like domain-containing protein, partial [Propionibacteriaceae bacterium]|nr:Ig-like domain-containing protein [Propionibacteriaceae bacterium]
MPIALGNSSQTGKGLSGPRLRKPIAWTASFVLAIGGVFLGQSLQAPLAQAVEIPGLANEGFDPQWTELTGVTANWKNDGAPLSDESVYWTSDMSTGNSLAGAEVPMLGESYDFSADATSYKTREVMSFTTSGAAFGSFVQFSTQAMAPIGGKDSGNAMSVYFWSHEGGDYVNQIDCGASTGLGAIKTIEVVRVTDGDSKVYGGCMPAPPMNQAGLYDGGASNGWGYATGGEGNQLTGQVYVQADYGFLDSNVADGNGSAINASWAQFQIWDPVTGESSWSGPIQPADTKSSMGKSLERMRLAAYITPTCPTGLEAGCTYGPMGAGSSGAGVETAADFGLDAQGNMYIFVSTPIATGAGQNGTAALVRISPSKDENGAYTNGSASNPWVYNVVRKLAKTDPGMVMAESAIWSVGTGIHDGKFLAGGYVNAYSTTQASLYPANMGAATAGSVAGTASRMLAIDPLSGSMSLSGSTDNQMVTGGTYLSTIPMSNQIGRVYRDNASPQMLTVIAGKVINDVNADGAYATDEPGVQGVRIAVYNGDNELIGTQLTAVDGSYSLVVSGDGDYQVRVNQPQIAGVNAAQTWGEIVASMNDATMHCVDGDITSGLAQCAGALARPYADPAVGAVNAADDPGTWPIYASVSMSTNEEVAEVNFGISTLGSYGDAKAGPANVAAGAPVHANGIAGQEDLWLGSALGSYTGVSTKDDHTATDDGVSLKLNSGNVPLTTDQILAATHQYNLTATVNGDQAANATVSGWTTGAGNDNWVSAANWTPTVAGNTADGAFQVMQSGNKVSGTPTVQFRANASTSATTQATNAANEYQAKTGASTSPWVTSGEVEDYSFKVADAVVRAAVLNAGDTGTFQIKNGSTSESLTAGRDSAVVFGKPVATSAGSNATVSSTAPNGAVLRSVTVKDSTTGADVAVTPTTSGMTSTVTFPVNVGDDVTVQFNYGAVPDASKSTLTLDPASGSAVVSGDGIKAIATIVDKDGLPISGYVVNFSQKSADVTADANTCTTDDQGVCSITVNSAKPGVYTDQIAATVIVNGVDTAVSGSPKSVTFTAGEFSYTKSTFTVDPVVSATDAAKTNWVAVSDGSAYYTGTLTAMDDAENRLSELDLADISFMTNSGQVKITSVVNEGNGVYTVQYSSQKADASTTASLTYDGKAVGSALPIPFKAGAFNPDPTCSDPTLTGSNLKADPASVMVGGSSSIKAHATDEFCNPLPNTTVSFGLVGSSDATISANTAVTDANGDASVTVTDSTVESVDVAGSVDGTA